MKAFQCFWNLGREAENKSWNTVWKDSRNIFFIFIQIILLIARLLPAVSGLYFVSQDGAGLSVTCLNLICWHLVTCLACRAWRRTILRSTPPRSHTPVVSWGTRMASIRSSVGCGSRSACCSEWSHDSIHHFVCVHRDVYWVHMSSQASITPRSAAVAVALEAGPWPQTGGQSERRDACQLRKQRALLPETWSFMGKSRGERKKAGGCTEPGTDIWGEGKNSVQVFVNNHPPAWQLVSFQPDSLAWNANVSFAGLLSSALLDESHLSLLTPPMQGNSGMTMSAQGSVTMRRALTDLLYTRVWA